MMSIEWLCELRDWLTALPPEFAFLLALPFVVAALGLLRLRWPPKPKGTSSPSG